MLLLTQILRPRYRGVIHLGPSSDEGRPEIEFSGGEGPEQVMDQVQDFAVSEIRKCIEPLGPFLRWQELDLEAGVLRRHRSSIRDRLEFVLCPDDRGIELVLGDGEERVRPWVPLMPHAEPGAEQRAQIGWKVAEPRLTWRYFQTRYAPPAIELTWSCGSLPGEWAARVLARAGHLDCRIGDGSGDDLRCRMDPTRDGLLVYRGYLPLPIDDRRPASRRLALRQPLVVVGPESGFGQLQLDEEVPATVAALDFRALVGDRPTRLVARADLDRPFAAEIVTGGDVTLPGTIRAGTIPGVPWTLVVTATGVESPAGSPGTGANGTPPGTGAVKASPPRDPAEAANRQRWLLKAQPQPGRRGSWDEVTWQGGPPELAFGLGSFDPARAPRITRIENRRASVGWRIEADDDGGRMCLSVPHWVPVGCPQQVASPETGAGGTSPGVGTEGAPRRDGASPGNSFDYAAEVRAPLSGLEERFVIDQRSELPYHRLFLGPRRWRFRDEVDGEIAGGEALGEGAGCVRWRRAGSDGDFDTSPTDWAGGSAPVLLVKGDGDDPLQWGGLYAPRAVPWDAMDEVSPEPASGTRDILLVPRSSPRRGANGTTSRSTAIWIDLWGFVCRYDVRPVTFARSHGETSEITAWFAGTGLELFPQPGGYLLRSFSPLYAVRDPEPRTFSLQPASPRPILRVGRELVAGTGSRHPGRALTEHRPGQAPTDFRLEIGGETYLHCQVAAAGELPRAFEPGRVPGTPLRLDRMSHRVAWFAVEQRDGEAGRRAGYLLSWDATGGWRFRGFFAHRDAAVELGVVGRGDSSRRVMLGDEGASCMTAFRLTLDAGGVHWSDGTPEPVRRALTPEMIRQWETCHFTPERRPAPLAGYGLRIRQQASGGEPWIFELTGGTTPEAGAPAGIRVWELQGEAGEDFAGDARVLGDDPAERLPREPEKRILRADEDDDDDF